jgi:hypothetical protein
VSEEKPRREHRGRLLQPYCNPSTKGIVEGLGSMILHIGEQMRVRVQGDGYGSVAQHLGDYLGVDVL